MHDSLKVGFICVHIFNIKLKLEFSDLLKEGEHTKTWIRRATMAAATKASAHRTLGTRRAYAAARPPHNHPPQSFPTKQKPCHTPEGIDQVYDLELGRMFAGEQGGVKRSLAGTAISIEQYTNFCCPAQQFNSELLTSTCIDRTIRSTGSTASSFDHIYQQEAKPTTRARAELPPEPIEQQCKWPINLPQLAQSFSLNQTASPTTSQTTGSLSNFNALQIMGTVQAPTTGRLRQHIGKRMQSFSRPRCRFS